MADEKTVTMTHPERDFDCPAVPEWAVPAKEALGWVKVRGTTTTGGDATNKEK